MCKNVKNVELETEIDARYLKSPEKENSLPLNLNMRW